MLRFVANLAWGIALIGAVMSTPVMAEGRDFYEIKMDMDMSTYKFYLRVREPNAATFSEIDKSLHQALPADSFAQVELRLILSEQSAGTIQKMVDQGFTSEPSGCAPGAYGPLDMEEDLRYFAIIKDVEDDDFTYNLSVYPGDRSRNWINDVYCEYDEELGTSKAVLHLTGYYYVKYRKLQNGIDTVYRGVTLTESEINNLTKKKN